MKDGVDRIAVTPATQAALNVKSHAERAVARILFIALPVHGAHDHIEQDGKKTALQLPTPTHQAGDVQRCGDGIAALEPVEIIGEVFPARPVLQVHGREDGRRNVPARAARFLHSVRARSRHAQLLRRAMPSSMSRSSNWPKSRPMTLASWGTRLVEVMPGRVLTSSRVRFWSASRMKSARL